MFGEGLHSLQELVEESQIVLGVEHPTVSSEAHGKIASVITYGYGGSQRLISKLRCSCSPPSVKGSVVTTDVANGSSVRYSGPIPRRSFQHGVFLQTGPLAVLAAGGGIMGNDIE